MKLRLRRIINPQTKRTFLLALDHGFTSGPLSGLENIPLLLNKIPLDHLDGIILHKGMARASGQLIMQYPSLSLIMHLSGATVFSHDPFYKRTVCSVENAMHMGADGVSCHINLGSKMEAHMLAESGKIQEDCNKFGLPLLVMIYPRGEKIEDAYSPEYIGHAVRVAEELGADLIKTVCPRDMSKFEKIMGQTHTPVIIAGGAKNPSEEYLFKMTEEALKSGASGVCFGRNIFQHKESDLMIRIIKKIVHEDLSVKEALDIMKSKEIRT